MVKLSRVFEYAKTLLSVDPGFSCNALDSAASAFSPQTYEEVRILREEVKDFYFEICCANKWNEAYTLKEYVFLFVRPKGMPEFWDSQSHVHYLEARLQMLELARLSAERYEHWLYAKEHDIPIDETYRTRWLK